MEQEREYLERINKSLMNDIIGTRKEISKLESFLKELRISVKSMEKSILKNIESMPFIDID